MSKAAGAIIPVTAFEQNCALIWCAATKRAVVIDPGGDVDRLLQAIEKSGVTVEKILITHGHIDHAGGAAELKEKLGVPVEGPHRADQFLLENLVDSAASFGLTGVRNLVPDRWCEEGEQIRVGELTFDILHCPGHSPGSVVYVNREQRFALVGDVLFRGSIGRTDLPGGDHQTLLRSIADKLLPLGDEMAILSGHGPASTIGTERTSNPFLV